MNIKAIRGMHDILPEQTPLWQRLEQSMANVLAAYGYQEIRMPIVEKTELFKRSIGEVTDIVEKEMYSFDDRNGDSLTLRPEGTAGCVRAAIENGMLRSHSCRLWYMGPMFRHERPQKGRYRQFNQVGVETFGLKGPDIDIELILMSARLWKAIGLCDIKLQLNSLGSVETRALYREKLVEYFSDHKNKLDEDSQRRLDTNPLRILDSKNTDMQALIEKAPVLIDCLDDESRTHFETLKQGLDTAGLAYEINPRLVRGLDYYCKTVFEWVSDHLGAQGTVCAGGRFDGLVEQMGGKPTPAAGFAIGLERLIVLMQEAGVVAPDQSPHVYLVLVGDEAQTQGIKLSETLRSTVSGLRMVVNCGAGSYKSQFKRADKSGAHYALILGEDEIALGKASIKGMRHQQEQISLDENELINFLTKVTT